MAVLKNFFIIFMVIVFSVSVLTYGSGRTFSTFAYFSGIVNGFNDIPDIQGLIDIWKDSESEFARERLEYSTRSVYSSRSSDDDGFFAKVGDFFDYVSDFFSAIGRFFSNLWESIAYIVKMIFGIFALIPRFLPWNATVPI